MPVSEKTPTSLLAFVHVHKTGGTSLEQIFLHNDWPMYNIRSPDMAKAFIDLPAGEQGTFHGVYGHMPFGIHRYVERPVTYMTFLRDPVERVLSAYAHNLRHPEEPGAETIREIGLAWTARPLNFMCRILCDYDLLQQPDADGRFWWSGGPDFVPRAFLDEAKRNLDRCSFIGLTESYDLDCRTLSESELEGHRINVPPAVPRTKTSGAEKINRSDLSPEQIAAIRAANRLDIELYEHALALRDQWGGPVRRQGRQARPSTVATTASRADPIATESERREADLDWRILPAQIPAGPAPHTLTIDTPLYAYGAATGVLKASRCILSLSVEALTGSVGLMLCSPDGSEVLSPEYLVSSGEPPAQLRFDLSPDWAPAILVVRNRDVVSAPGELVVHSAEYLPPA